jgi:hypothetical protein
MDKSLSRATLLNIGCVASLTKASPFFGWGVFGGDSTFSKSSECCRPEEVNVNETEEVYYNTNSVGYPVQKFDGSFVQDVSAVKRMDHVFCEASTVLPYAIQCRDVRLACCQELIRTSVDRHMRCATTPVY